jgi:hypothetical protein
VTHCAAEVVSRPNHNLNPMPASTWTAQTLYSGIPFGSYASLVRKLAGPLQTDETA